MRRLNHHNAFTADFLRRRAERDTAGPSTAEAAFAGPWRVVARPDGRFAVLHGAEPDTAEPDTAEHDTADLDAVEALFDERETALLFAAFYPALGRDNPFRFGDAITAEPGPGVALERVTAGRVTTVGRVRFREPEILDALHLAETLLRSPRALAHLLEAASYDALRRAGRDLARRAEGEEPR